MPRRELQVGDIVTVPWGLGRVRGLVKEIYGGPNRQVVVLIGPETTLVTSLTTFVFSENVVGLA